MFEWNKTKQQKNLTKHGVDFDLVWELDWNREIHTLDDRKEYGEVRIIGMVPEGERLYICIYTKRGDAKRIISLRKANEREIVKYEKAVDDERW